MKGYEHQLDSSSSRMSFFLESSISRLFFLQVGTATIIAGTKAISAEMRTPKPNEETQSPTIVMLSEFENLKLRK